VIEKHTEEIPIMKKIHNRVINSSSFTSVSTSKETAPIKYSCFSSVSQLSCFYLLLIFLFTISSIASENEIIYDTLLTKKTNWGPWNDTNITQIKPKFGAAGCSLYIIKPGYHEYEASIGQPVTILKEKTYKIQFIASSDSSSTVSFGFKQNKSPWFRYATRLLRLTPNVDTFNLTWINNGPDAIDFDDIAFNISFGAARGILNFKKISITEHEISPSDSNFFECPIIPKIDPPIKNSSTLPGGLLAYSYSGAGTIFLSPINKWAPVALPGIISSANNIFFSDNGHWLLYSNDSCVFIVNINGKYKTKVPVTSSFTTCGFYRSSPYGQEIFYDSKQSEILKAIPVMFSDTSVLFGTERLIADLGNKFDFDDYYQINVVKDQIWSGIKPVVNDTSYKRSGFLTIPDSGKGVALPENVYKFSDNNNEEVYGCNHTMSHDGDYCVAIPGHAGETGDFSHCAPAAHKGFYVTRFYHDKDPPVDTREQVHRYSYSLNWCPSQYMFGLWDEVDFNLYQFSNNSRILIATQSGSLSPRKGIWAIDWKDNIWYPLSPDSIQIEAIGIAAFIGEYDTHVFDSLLQINDTSTSDTTIKNPIGYKILRPSAGEFFHPGDQCTIKVVSVENGNASIKLQFDKYGFNLFQTAVNPKKDSIFTYIIPPYFLSRRIHNGVLYTDTLRPNSSRCRIAVEHYTPGVCDLIVSDTFSIFQVSGIAQRQIMNPSLINTAIKRLSPQQLLKLIKSNKLIELKLYDLLGRPIFRWNYLSDKNKLTSFFTNSKSNIVFIAKFSYIAYQ
jgi:hypothetical protein